MMDQPETMIGINPYALIGRPTPPPKAETCHEEKSFGFPVADPVSGVNLHSGPGWLHPGLLG